MGSQSTWGIVLAAAGLLSACESQVDSSYRGEPLGTLRGNLTGAVPSGAAEGAAVGVLWMKSERTPEEHVGEYVEVEGSFPAAFTLDFFSPPAAGVLRDDLVPEEKFSLGLILVVRPGSFEGADYTDDAWADVNLLGGSAEYVIGYVESALTVGSRVAQHLGGPLAAGYHLLRAISPTDAEIDAAGECSDGAATDEERDACYANLKTRYEPEPWDTRIVLSFTEPGAMIQLPEIE